MNYFREKIRGEKEFCMGEEGVNPCVFFFPCGFVQIEPRENYRCEKKECVKWCPWYLTYKMISLFFLKITNISVLGAKSLLNV